MSNPAPVAAIFPTAFTSLPGAPTWDESFKIAQIGFLRLVPFARSQRETLFAIAAGFDGHGTALVHDLYRRNGIASCDLATIIRAGETMAPLLARLEAATGKPAHKRFDFLSLAPGHRADEICGCITAGTYRPGLIHQADANAAGSWPQARAELLRIGYALAGEMQGGELLVDAALLDADAKKPVIATFNVFETLITRRCIDPWRVFEEVGHAIGRADFLEQRRAAEARVLHTGYVFDDIYDGLALHYGWDVSERQRVQALEVERERANVMPIAENMVRVKDGDLLVSDMYLSEAQIRGLVEKAGLSARVGLMVESHGKASGRVWPEIKNAFVVTRHLGDNPNADIAVAERFGLATRFTEAGTPTLIERMLLDSGLRNLALLMREVRLATWHDDPTIRPLQLVQASLNIPLLIVASVALARRAKAVEASTVLFSSAGCALWQPLFEALQQKIGCAFDTDTFLTSRIACEKGSQDYLAYARRLLKPRTLAVDLVGTGPSMTRLAARLQLPTAELFLLDDGGEAEAAPLRVHPLITRRPNADDVVLRLANASEHRMVVDMRAVGNTFVPVLSRSVPSPTEIEAIRQQRLCLVKAVECLPHHTLDEVLALDDASLAFVCASIYEAMTRQLTAFRLFETRFFEEEDAVSQALTGSPAARIRF